MMDLCCGEGSAHVADSLGVGLSLLLDLQKLCGLYERLQSLFGTAVCQLSLRQPLLQLPNIVPDDGGIEETIQIRPRYCRC